MLCLIIDETDARKGSARLKYDTATAKWTIFELPVRGTEIRHIALDERGGKTQVILPVYRTNQMGGGDVAQ